MGKMSEQAKIALVVVAMIAIAGGFWLLLLSPKRDKASELSEQITGADHRSRLRQAAGDDGAGREEELRHRLPAAGRARRGGAGGSGDAVAAGPAERAQRPRQDQLPEHRAGQRRRRSARPSAEGSTELLPLGASAGPSGFAAMPYTLDFEGGFFDITKFIDSLDGLVTTKAPTGRSTRTVAWSRSTASASPPVGSKGNGRRRRLLRRALGELRGQHLRHPARPGPDRRRHRSGPVRIDLGSAMKIDWNKQIQMPRPSLSWLRSLFSRLRDMLNRGPSFDTPRLSIKARRWGAGARRSRGRP